MVGQSYKDENEKYHTCYKILDSVYPSKNILCFDTGKFEYEDHVQVYWKKVDNVPGKQLNLWN